MTFSVSVSVVLTSRLCDMYALALLGTDQHRERGNWFCHVDNLHGAPGAFDTVHNAFAVSADLAPLPFIGYLLVLPLCMPGGQRVTACMLSIHYVYC